MARGSFNEFCPFSISGAALGQLMLVALGRAWLVLVWWHMPAVPPHPRCPLGSFPAHIAARCALLELQQHSVPGQAGSCPAPAVPAASALIPGQGFGPGAAWAGLGWGCSRNI